MKRLCTLDDFVALSEQQRRETAGPIATQMIGEPEMSETARTIRYVFSTPEVGRDMHTVAARAWQLENFLRNPVFLWAHDDSQPPIGRVIEIGDVNGMLRGTVEYAERDLNPFADLIYRLVRAKYLNATSTSWQPIEWSFSRDKTRPGGIDFTKVDLLEISQVPIPALPEALAEARRSLGVDTSPLYRWAERMLDGEGMIALPRLELEELRRAARMPAPIARADSEDEKTDAEPERVTREAFLFMRTRAPEGMFAQCGTCVHFIEGSGQCEWFSKSDEVVAGGSCGLYVHGQPKAKKPLALASPEEAGYVVRPVRCGNCRYFDSTDEPQKHCDLYTQLNLLAPNVFDLDRYVDEHDCCNAQTPGERDPAVFEPYGPIDHDDLGAARQITEQLRRASKMASRVVRTWQVGASKDLPIFEDNQTWDGSEAEKSIFEAAGGDPFSTEKVRSAFLIYDESDPAKRESYKIPIARAVDGELKVSANSIKAALTLLSETDVPKETKERAQEVLDHYKGKFGADDDAQRARRGGPRRRLNRGGPKFRRGLYECGQLGYFLMQLGYMHDQSKIEEALEADEDSELPELLGSALKELAEAFLEMAEEEVEELLEQVEVGEEEIPEGERAFVARAKNPRVRAFRRGIAAVRAGRSLSAAKEEKLAAADRHCDRALDHHRATEEHHEEVSGHIEALRGLHKRASSTLADLGYDHHKVTRAMGDMSDRIEELADSHEDSRDSHSMIGRSVKGCQRCVRAVMEGTAPIEEDDDKETREARLARARKLTAVG